MDLTAQNGHANESDWEEQVYQKVICYACFFILNSHNKFEGFDQCCEYNLGIQKWNLFHYPAFPRDTIPGG